ncbi:Carnitine O-acetyltransferase [Fukomys damarensis]|uniref:Carnitine O-acetyltransferase n=1 Tax=Fukomys damarensis TaxID=885580 RepID=A0A091DMH2_FUKDA|nr:Carnitine O-acetyltransferase [Fukomys damarensis]
MNGSSVPEHQKVELLRRAMQAPEPTQTPPWGGGERGLRPPPAGPQAAGHRGPGEHLLRRPVAMHFNLSTSQVPAKTDCHCLLACAPRRLRCGVCYNPMETHHFSVSAYNSCAETRRGPLPG